MASPHIQRVCRLKGVWTSGVWTYPSLPTNPMIDDAQFNDDFKAVPWKSTSGAAPLLHRLYFAFIYKGSTTTTTAGVPNLRSSARRTFFHFQDVKIWIKRIKIGDCRVVGSDVISSEQSRCCCLLLFSHPPPPSMVGLVFSLLLLQ